MSLVLLSFFAFIIIIFSTAFDYEYSVQTFTLISIICLILVVTGFWLHKFRTYEKAKLHFHQEGIIMSTKDGFIPLKYSQIKKLSISNIVFNKKKAHFYIFSKDDRKFEIQTDKDVYDGLIDYFPED